MSSNPRPNSRLSRPSNESSDIEEIYRPSLEAQYQIQQQVTRPGNTHEPELFEDVPRPGGSQQPPRQHVWNPPPVLINTTPWRRYAAFISLALFDCAMNASAGAAAATVGAKGNHKPLTAQVIRLGALAGVTKAGITSFRQLVLMSPVNVVLRMLLLLVFSSFGICLILTAEVCNLVLDETPKEFLIAAVVAGIPLIFECIRDLEPKPDEEGNVDYISRPCLSIFLLVSNPIGGYVFARMASNQGRPISNYSAACSAGAAYAIITFLSRTITACVVCVQITHNGVTRNIFGRYEWYQPEPVVITDEEHRRVGEMIDHSVEVGFQRLKRLTTASEGPRSFMLRVAAVLTCCLCCVDREVRRKAKEKLRKKAKEQNEFTAEMEVWAEALHENVAGRRPTLHAQVVDYR